MKKVKVTFTYNVSGKEIIIKEDWDLSKIQILTGHKLADEPEEKSCSTCLHNAGKYNACMDTSHIKCIDYNLWQPKEDEPEETAPRQCDMCGKKYEKRRIKVNIV